MSVGAVVEPRAPGAGEVQLVDCIRARRQAEIRARLFRDLLIADGHAPAVLDQIVSNHFAALKAEVRGVT